MCNHLRRIVKLWAKLHGLNDGAAGTFNSWSLTLMVLFHLQTVRPAILPPLWCLFYDQAPQETEPRLLQQPGLDLSRAAGIARERVGCAAGFGAANGSSLFSLFASFIASYYGITQQWTAGKHRYVSARETHYCRARHRHRCCCRGRR